MATLTISPTFAASYFLAFHLFFVCFVNNGCTAFEQREIAESQHFHTVHLTSLSPSSVCSPSISTPATVDKKSSIQVIHMHGPCSQPEDKSNAPTHAEILLRDQARVDAIHSRVSSARPGSGVKQIDAVVNIPAKSGASLGSGNYIVEVGLGTPKKDLSLTFDTGSDLTWTQCEPCADTKCYKQVEPKYDPSASKSFSKVSCPSSQCTSLLSQLGNQPNCSESACAYSITYGDMSFTDGFLGKERLSLTPTEALDNILFGCGKNNQGLFGGVAGLIGLGPGELSLPSQTAQRYNKLFSYCLPSSPSETGHLTFGNGGGFSRTVEFTPLSLNPRLSAFYSLDITAISVGGQKLPISGTVFSSAGAIIDSGTVITRLPPKAYAALKSAFGQKMTKYPMAQAFSILDTCYDFSKYTTITIPTINIFFKGGVEVDIDQSGILYGNSVSQVCLAFAANSDDSEVAIIGNQQQKTLEVVYDRAGRRVGFAAGGCS